jgi:hypothetical protein
MELEQELAASLQHILKACNDLQDFGLVVVSPYHALLTVVRLLSAHACRIAGMRIHVNVTAYCTIYSPQAANVYRTMRSWEPSRGRVVWFHSWPRTTTLSNPDPVVSHYWRGGLEMDAGLGTRCRPSGSAPRLPNIQMLSIQSLFFGLIIHLF